MTEISLIAAMDEDNGIGINNQLLCHLPADLQHFKAITLGKPIVMGRKTYESIGRPLPGRLNVVLSRKSKAIQGVSVYPSIDKVLKELQHIPELMIIGGAQLYAETIELAHRLYITRIHHHFKADVFFPVINLEQWNCVNQEFRQQDEKNQYDMTFSIYEKNY